MKLRQALKIWKSIKDMPSGHFELIRSDTHRRAKSRIRQDARVHPEKYPDGWFWGPRHWKWE